MRINFDNHFFEQLHIFCLKVNSLKDMQATLSEKLQEHIALAIEVHRVFSDASLSVDPVEIDTAAAGLPEATQVNSMQGKSTLVESAHHRSRSMPHAKTFNSTWGRKRCEECWECQFLLNISTVIFCRMKCLKTCSLYEQ